MSQSIRISDELAAVAKNQGKLFHRSPPQQIEHWAAIGRVMESALSYSTRERIFHQTAGRDDLDEALESVETPEGARRSREAALKTSARIVSREE